MQTSTHTHRLMVTQEVQPFHTYHKLFHTVNNGWREERRKKYCIKCHMHVYLLTFCQTIHLMYKIWLYRSQLPLSATRHRPHAYNGKRGARRMKRERGERKESRREGEGEEKKMDRV